MVDRKSRCQHGIIGYPRFYSWSLRRDVSFLSWVFLGLGVISEGIEVKGKARRGLLSRKSCWEIAVSGNHFSASNEMTSFALHLPLPPTLAWPLLSLTLPVHLSLSFGPAAAPSLSPPFPHDDLLTTCMTKEGEEEG